MIYNILAMKLGVMFLINIQNLSFSYNKRINQLEKVNIHIPKGAYVSIIGSNGSGKTTLVKLILNQLKPTSGNINIETKNIGYVPQRLDSFNSQFTISVNEILSCHGNALKLSKESKLKALEEVNMSDKFNSLIGSLSGGQCQKILIARAFMGNPDLLILDEMSAGVDSTAQKEIYSLVENFNTKKNMTILSVEHNLPMALKYSTHILDVSDNSAKLYTIDEYKKFTDKNTEYIRKVD